ncbi:MAG: phosphoribosylformylglycinamidine synthase subunit PurL, partial [Geminicoccaceae bacterium]
SAAAWLFGEDQGRYLLAVAPDRLPMVEAAAGRAGVLARRVGTTGGVALTLDGGDAISLQELAEIHRSWLPSLMGTT